MGKSDTGASQKRLAGPAPTLGEHRPAMGEHRPTMGEHLATMGDPRPMPDEHRPAVGRLPPAEDKHRRTLGDPAAVRQCLAAMAPKPTDDSPPEPLGLLVATLRRPHDGSSSVTERRKTPAAIRDLLDDGILPCPRRDGETKVRTAIAVLREDADPHSP